MAATGGGTGAARSVSDLIKKRRGQPNSLPQEVSSLSKKSSGGVGPVPATPSSASERSSAKRMSLSAMTMALSVSQKFRDTALSKRIQKDREKHHIQLENTYRMTLDDPKRRFLPVRTESIIQDTLELILRDKTYDAGTASRLTCVIANALKTRMKALQLPRHKLVCHVVVAPSTKHSSVNVTSRCLWDCRHDNYACVMYDENGIQCVATVFGVYFE